MMLILHIRLVDMEYCAFILMGTLPAASWIVAGCLVLVLSLVMGILLMLKLREVTVLKKQCEDLRETMRMMRYEEANLARMLHTASKTKEQAEQQPVASVTSDGEKEEHVEEMPPIVEMQVPEKELEVGQATEDTAAVQMTPASESVEEVIVSGDALPEETTFNDEINEALPSNVAIEEESLAVETVEESAQPIASVQKQPINERRPAIPTDLFAAWFAENEEEELLNGGPAEMVEVAELQETAVPELLEASPVAVKPVEVVEESPLVATEEPIVNEKVTMEGTVAEECPVTELNKEDERFCRKLERVVSTRMRNSNLNVDTIAAQFGIGRTNFYRKVRELTGMSPNDYLRKCRMERASELLCSSDAAISEVCAQVGIPDAQYFSRVFKSYFGTTPSVYRENNSK